MPPITGFPLQSLPQTGAEGERRYGQASGKVLLQNVWGLNGDEDPICMRDENEAIRV